MKELLEKLHSCNMLWLFLGANISADHLMSEHDCDGAMLIIRDIKNVIDDTNIDDDTKEKIKHYLDESEQIINDELSKFKTN